MLTIAYAGSFLMMEATAEKTEKTEKSDEALHSIYHGASYQRTIVKGKVERKRYSECSKEFYQALRTSNSNQPDFNVNHIYFSSYLRLLS